MKRILWVTVLVVVLVSSLPLVALAEEKSISDWLQISGEYRFRFDYLKGTVHEHTLMYYDPSSGNIVQNGFNEYDVNNNQLLTNRFRLNLKAKATENISVKARLAMYKVWGHQSPKPVNGYFMDRYFVEGAYPFDGTTGHVPSDNKLVVDTAYATWSNIADLPIWFSIGRRPSTEGIPTNIRMNREKVGTAGVPGLMIDYAFDGLTIGFAPYIEALEGFYAKVCYGKGYDSGFETDLQGKAEDTRFIGVNIVPLDTDTLHLELQWDRAFGIFNAFPDYATDNMGDIDQYGITATYTLYDLGGGDLNLFASAALSKTHPDDGLAGFDLDGDGKPDAYGGLLYDYNPMMGGAINKKSHTGQAYYLGARYDIHSTGTKIGAEFNYGSKYWIAFAPAGDDIWTSKLGTRGKVYEAYIIQEIKDAPISPNGKAFFRLGYQYYDFEYTGSNSWIGEPKKISDLSTGQQNTMYVQMFPPLDKAQDLYLMFEVWF